MLIRIKKTEAAIRFAPIEELRLPKNDNWDSTITWLPY